MKRIVAVLLTIVVIVGMAPVAVAADTAKLITISSTFALEDRYGKVSGKEPTDYLAGETLYYEVTSPEPAAALTLSGVKKGYHTNWSILDGAVRISSAAFVAKQNDTDEEKLYLAVKLKDTFQNSSNSMVDAEISITAKEGYGVTDQTGAVADTCLLPLACDVLYGVADGLGSGPHSVDESIFSFADDAGSVTLCFDRNVEVSGNMSGEHNLFLRLSTSNDSLQSKYPDAQLRLFDGNRKTFQRAVTIKMPMTAIEGANGKPAAPYLYELSDSGLKAAENATYSLKDEMFIVTTKTLGNYVISEEQINTTAADEEPSEPETVSPEQWAFSNGIEENPQTGGLYPLTPRNGRQRHHATRG